MNKQMNMLTWLTCFILVSMVVAKSVATVKKRSISLRDSAPDLYDQQDTRIRTVDNLVLNSKETNIRTVNNLVENSKVDAIIPFIACGSCTYKPMPRTLKGYICVCEDVDCATYKSKGLVQPGVYELRIKNKVMTGFCEDGWLVIQRRVDASVSFARKWTEYQQGFGEMGKNFWWGLDKMNYVTSTGNFKVRFDMRHATKGSKFAEYNSFKVGASSEKYKIHVTGFTGDASDGMKYHNGQQFSTMDRDNDKSSDSSCSHAYGGNGGFWFKSCVRVNINGIYHANGVCESWKGIHWDGVTSSIQSLGFVEMKVKSV